MAGCLTSCASVAGRQTRSVEIKGLPPREPTSARQLHARPLGGAVCVPVSKALRDILAHLLPHPLLEFRIEPLSQKDLVREGIRAEPCNLFEANRVTTRVAESELST
jgi:hypothetical protein